MMFAALATWVLAAVMGAYLLATWIANGGLRRRGGEQPSRFAPQLILGHGGLAATGLVVWITYLVLATAVLAWAALADLVLVALLGATMFGLWIRAGHGRSRGRHVAGPRHAAEDHFPPPAVVGHGLFAVATVVLVLVTALQTAGWPSS
jgi:manganese efflux pump family protein